jgi:predicted RNA-binding protein with PIN domain
VPRLVDGDNLLGSWPGRSRSEADKRTLIRDLARLAARERRRVVVVFDGSAPLGVAVGPDALFAGPGKSADERILELLRSQHDPRGWTVVTDDRALADRARWLGAGVERARSLRGRIEGAPPADKPGPGEDLAYWSEVFRDPDLDP